MLGIPGRELEGNGRVNGFFPGSLVITSDQDLSNVRQKHKYSNSFSYQSGFLEQPRAF